MNILFLSSVATTHSAPISTGTTMLESSFDVQPTAIGTSTTNLININISNSGNITAVASGENHQINKCYSTIAPSAQLRLQSNTQPRPTQYASLPLATSHTTEPQQQQLQQQQQRSPLTANINQIEVFGSDLNAISTIATTSVSAETNTDALSCNFKNCSITNSLTKPKNRNDVVFQTPQHNRVKKNGEASMALMRNQSNNTILPPPLFDESTTMSTATLPLLPNDSIRQLKSRRHHRTIPRHFTLNDSANSSNGTNSKTKANDESTKTNQNCSGTATLNKKSVCQCPVQHVPMTYMGSAYLNLTRNQQTNEMLLSTLTKKWPSQKSHVAKSASFTSTPSMASTNITTSSTAPLGYNRNSASGLLSATNPPKNNGSSNSSTTAAETQTNALLQPKIPSKISTISKQIGHNELNTIVQAQLQQQCNDASIDGKSMQELLPININSGKVSNSNALNATKIASDNDGLTLVPNANNPILPPKLSKAQVFSRQTDCVPSISKMATTTNCTSGSPGNGLTMSSSLTNHHRLSGRDRSKSPAADKTYSMVTPLNLGADQKINHIKTTYPTTANLTIASNHFTFPKPSSSAKTLLNIKNQTNPQNIASNSQSKSLNSKVHSSSSKAKKITSTLPNEISLRQELQTNDILNATKQIEAHRLRKSDNDKALPVCTTFTNCSNPKEHFLPNDTSLDDDYLSECENCKSAHGSRYYLDEEHVDQPQETMTLQRKIDEKECDEQPYYRTSSTLPTNTKQKTT